jgi:Icc-related predicted phosphoesterase
MYTLFINIINIYKLSNYIYKVIKYKYMIYIIHHPPKTTGTNRTKCEKSWTK